MSLTTVTRQRDAAPGDGWGVARDRMRVHPLVMLGMACSLRMWVLALAVVAPGSWAATGDKAVFERDVKFLLDELEQGARAFFDLKEIDWKAVRKEFTAAARKTKDEVEHVKLCARLVARLKDGHATLLDVDVKMPDEGPQHGVGLCVCEADGRVLIKQAFGPASGLDPGDEVLTIDGKKAGGWLDEKARELSDEHGFSTAHAARYAACHWGFGGKAGTRIEVEIDRGRRGKKKMTLTCDKSGGDPRYVGPVFLPKDLERLGRRDAYGVLESGYGYVVLGEVADDLAGELDVALGALGDVKGLILDMRANNGGGTDHEEVFGRFLAAGQKWKQYAGKDGAHFTGPVVVIVDAGTRSTGETISGMLKEDGRAYMIGATPTAGMSAQKTEITVPSGLFKVKFATASNKQRFNGGRGIEGLGVPPHEIVGWDAKLLGEGVDPFVRRAEELLKKGFPPGSVPYAPPKAKSR